MKITKYEMLSTEDTFAKLRTVRLRGHGQPIVYPDPDVKLQLASRVHYFQLAPTQSYVIDTSVNVIIDLYLAFSAQHGIDIFNLRGALLFWTDDMDVNKDPPIPLLPPIVEMSDEVAPSPLAGLRVALINDGMHRVYAANQRSSCINVIIARGVVHPYYAYPLPNGWRDVKGISKEELTADFKKKAYREPDDYKALFRDFNAVFEGIQKERVRI